VAKGDDDRPARPKSKGGDDDRPARPKSKGGGDDDGDTKPGKDSGGDDGDDANDAKEAPRPTAHVAKATDVYNEPSSNSDASFTAGPKTALYIVEEKGKWTFVENEEGDAGYVLTSKLDVDAPAAGPRALHIELNGGLGFAVISQSVNTQGGQP